MQEALHIAEKRFPDLNIDGEMALDTAVNGEIRKEVFPTSRLNGDANVLIFPDLNSANIAYKLMLTLGGAEGIGPIIMGMRKPVNVLTQGSTVEDIVNVASISAVTAQSEEFIV